MSTGRNDFLLSDSRALLDAADACEQVREYERRLPLSRIWADQNRSLKRDILERSGSAVEAVESLQAAWFQLVPPIEEARLAVEWHIDGLRKQGIDHKDLPPFAQESGFAPEDALVSADGRRYRPDFFRHLGTILRLRAAIGEYHVGRVVELGAGTGNLARLIKHYYPAGRYTIVDLPDTLVFSQMYLRLNFPEATFKWINTADDVAEAMDCDFAFCPVGFESALAGRSFDLFVNTASLGEMRAPAVEYWFRFVQSTITVRWILSYNRFLNTIRLPDNAWRIAENTSAMRFDARWHILDWELEPPFARCPFVNKHARHLLVIAERTEQSAGSVERSAALLAEATAGSWNKPPLEMTYQDNVLVSDMTTSGILFRLWESIRLDRRSDNTLQMLGYLRTLVRDQQRPFEEIPQYEALLRGSDETAPSTILAPDPPILVGAIGSHNLVLFAGLVYAVPQVLGPVQIDKIQPADFPSIIIAESVERVRSKLRAGT